MKLTTPFRMLSRAGGAALLLAACGPNDGPIEYTPVDYGNPETVDAGSGITGDGAPSSTPMLAYVDPNASMQQTPGQGVGVFAQYASTSSANPGGHWYVWWTCDTNLSGQACNFNVKITTAHGVITNPTTQGFLPTDSLSTGSQSDEGQVLVASTTTTTTVQGVNFDTDPGDSITLAASLGGDYSGSFLFFVQDGKVDGDYKGVLTDPLELEPSSP